MSYAPPPGRDELGNPVVAAPPEEDTASSTGGAKKKGGGGAAGADGAPAAPEAPKGTWEEKQDEWGQKYYVNDVTGETSWEPPPEEVADDGSLVQTLGADGVPRGAVGSYSSL
jgi:hypothetical protein